MKKFFAIVLVICLLCGMTTFADDSNRNTELKAVVDSGYTIIIPSSLTIGFEANSTNLTVQVTKLHLSSKYNALQVQVGSMPPLTSGDNTLWYTIDNATFGATRYFTTTGAQNFVIGITDERWNKAPAGTYTSTVSFNVQPVNKEESN